MALLWKMIYNLGDPMSLRHPVVVLNDFNLEEDGMFPFFPFFLSFFFFLSFLLDFPVAFIPKLLLRYG